MAADKEKIAKKEPVTKKVVTTKKKVEVAKNAQFAYGVLIEPWITEKTHSAISENKYSFKIALDADKKKVKKAVEGLYGVTVTKIAIVNIHAKKRNFGRHVGTKSAIKKAIVSVAIGQTIELFKGV